MSDEDTSVQLNSKLAVIALTTVFSAVVTVFGWWISNTHNKLNELQIEMAKNSEVVSNIKEKIDQNLKMEDDIDSTIIRLTLIEAEISKHKQKIESMDSAKFDMPDYDKYIKPVIEDLVSRISRIEQKTGNN